MKESRGQKVFNLFNYAFMTLLALMVVIPIMYIWQLTLSQSPDPAFRMWPKVFTLENYRFVVENNIILRPLLNSITLSTTSTVFSMVMTCILAYPLADRGLPGRSVFNFLVVLPMLINLGFLPKYLLIRELGLLNSYLGIVLVGGIGSFNLIIMRNYFQSLPSELFDSARIDGASEWATLARIVIPLSLPVIATIALFYFVDMWNAYFTIVLYISDSRMHTLQVILRSIIIKNEEIDREDPNMMLLQNIKYTTVIVALIPVLLLYPFLQRYFTKGILLGSLKG